MQVLALGLLAGCVIGLTLGFVLGFGVALETGSVYP